MPCEQTCKLQLKKVPLSDPCLVKTPVETQVGRRQQLWILYRQRTRLTRSHRDWILHTTRTPLCSTQQLRNCKDNLEWVETEHDTYRTPWVISAVRILERWVWVRVNPDDSWVLHEMILTQTLPVFLQWPKIVVTYGCYSYKWLLTTQNSFHIHHYMCYNVNVITQVPSWDLPIV